MFRCRKKSDGKEDRQSDSQTDRQIDGQTDRSNNGQTNKMVVQRIDEPAKLHGL